MASAAHHCYASDLSPPVDVKLTQEGLAHAPFEDLRTIRAHLVQQAHLQVEDVILFEAVPRHAYAYASYTHQYLPVSTGGAQH